MVSLTQENGVFVLTSPISFKPDTIEEINKKLDQVEQNSGPTALVLASSHPRIFNAGMDLKFMAARGPEGALQILTPLLRLCGRLLNFSVPTVSAIAGHVVAGGVIYALAADYRILAQESASVRMNEINLGIVLPRVGNSILSAKLHPAVHRDLLLRGKSFNAQESLAANIVDKLCPKDNVLEEAKALAQELSGFGENKSVYRLLKYSTYQRDIDIALNEEFTEEERQAILAWKQPKL